MSQPALVEKQASAELINLNNILFTTDFSESSLAALPYAAAVARRYGSKIFIAHVAQPHPYPLISGEAVTFLDELSQGARRELDEVAASQLLEGIEIKTLLGHGEVTFVMNRLIRENHIDLVITGTHGRRGFRRFFLGSVAEEIFRTSPCPVLTVGPHVSPSGRETLSLRNVLHPTGLTEETSGAYRYALAFTLEYGARLTVLHVMKSSVPGPGWQSAKDCYDQMEAQIPPEAKTWCEIDCHVAAGDPADVILKVAEEKKADLIVLGVREASALASHRMGGVAYRVVTEAGCPVLAIRNGAFRPVTGKQGQ